MSNTLITMKTQQHDETGFVRSAWWVLVVALCIILLTLPLIIYTISQPTRRLDVYPTNFRRGEQYMGI